MLIEKSAIAKWRMAQNLAAIAKRVIPASDEVMELNDLGRMARLPLLGKIKTQLTGAATSTAQDLAKKSKNLPGMDWQTKKWSPYNTTTLPVEQTFDAAGNPQQLFRVHHATQATNPYTSSYSKNFSHATPVPRIVEQCLDQGIHQSLVPRAFESKADFPAILSVLDAAKQQRYYPDFGIETAKGNFFPIQFKPIKEMVRELFHGRNRKLGKTYQQTVANYLKNPQRAEGFKPATPSGLLAIHNELHETAVRPGRNPIQQVYAVLQNNGYGTGSQFTPLSEQQRRVVQSLATQAATKINLPQTPTRFVNQKIQSVTEPFSQRYPETTAGMAHTVRRGTRLLNRLVSPPEKRAGIVPIHRHTIQSLAKQAAQLGNSPGTGGCI